jgi:AcrR family transcriptional regulator
LPVKRRYALAVPTLTRDRIIAAAVTIADRDGFGGVTLRRIAAELGVHVTSLYNHVPTRDAVTDGIIERLIDEAKLPTSPVSWEEWVRSFFSAMGTIAATHPGAFAALQLRPVQGPRAAASFEVALEAFIRAGLAPEDAYSAVKAASLTSLAVAMERGMAAQGAQYETALEDLPPEAFPEVRRVASVADPEAAWSFSLDTLLSGLRAQVRRRKQ